MGIRLKRLMKNCTKNYLPVTPIESVVQRIKHLTKHPEVDDSTLIGVNFLTSCKRSVKRWVDGVVRRREAEILSVTVMAPLRILFVNFKYKVFIDNSKKSVYKTGVKPFA